MDDTTRVQISTYVDGQLPPGERAEVEALLASDPDAARLAAELAEIAEIFGEIEPEPVSADLRERLLALEQVAPVEGFQPVVLPIVRRTAWVNWAAAAAAAALLVVGINVLTWRPPVEIHEVARMVLAPDGSVAEVRRDRLCTLRAGEPLRAEPGERLSFRLDGGTAIVLLPGTTIALGDPRAGEMFDLETGTALCTVADRGEPRTVTAGAYRIRCARADFGVRVEAADTRAAGIALAAAPVARLTVAVSVGEVEVGRNGDRERVRASESVVLRPGAAPERSDARSTAMYEDLMRTFRVFAREVLPGYFEAEPGVTPLARDRWCRVPDGGLELVLSDGAQGAQAGWLVLRLRATTRTEVTLTLVRPRTGEEAVADVITRPVGVVGPDWSVHAVRLDEFRTGGAGAELRTISPGRRALARLELRAGDPEAWIELKASLWAARPPAGAEPAEKPGVAAGGTPANDAMTEEER